MFLDKRHRIRPRVRASHAVDDGKEAALEVHEEAIFLHLADMPWVERRVDVMHARDLEEE